MRRPRLGLFGGTFDPIHLGHLRSAEEVREAFSLDRVLFIPALLQPHKGGSTPAPARDRLRMAELAVAKNPALKVSAIELRRPGKSYSVDTLRHFAALRPRAELYFILGWDAFLAVHRWKDFEDVFFLSHFIVTSRPGYPGALALRRLPVVVRRLFCYDRKKHAYRHRSAGNCLFFHPITGIAISASDIRKRVREGKSIRYLVPREVELYIKARHLYRGGGKRRQRDYTS